jgi:hypothetical protein
MKAEFEYSEDDVKEMVMKHHIEKWGRPPEYKKWEVSSDYYRGFKVNLVDATREEGID